MAKYNYAARNMDGSLINGIIDAFDERDVRLRLRQRGFYATSIATANEQRLFRHRKKIKADAIAAFAEQLAVMVDAGLHLAKCLTILAEQAKNEELSRIIDDIREHVEGGATLADSFARHPKVFAPIFVSLVRTGELGGVLDKVLRQLADYLDRDLQVKQKIKSALVYPKMVLVVCFATAVFMLSFVVPRFSVVYDRLGLQLPLPTIILVKLSGFILNFWWTLPGVIIVVIVAYKKFSATDTGREILDKLKLRVPVFGDLNRKEAVSRFVRVLGALDTSGVSIMQSLDMAADIVDNVIMRRVVDSVSENVRAGGNLEEPIAASRMFPSMVVQMLAVGEQAGKLGETLAKSADYLERELDTTVKRLIARIEPAMTILMAMIVGLFAVAIYLPMFDIVKLMNR